MLASEAPLPGEESKGVVIPFANVACLVVLLLLQGLALLVYPIESPRCRIEKTSYSN